jgi:hypothetical protein
MQENERILKGLPSLDKGAHAASRQNTALDACNLVRWGQHIAQKYVILFV